MLSICLLAMTLGMAAPSPNVVVVCPPQLAPELQPWIDHRTEQGFHIALIGPQETAEQTRAAILRSTDPSRLMYVVLVGDVPLEEPAEAVRAGIPTFHAPARVNIHWGSEPHIATDNPYGDLNGDGLPDVAVGRLSAATPQQLRTVVRKIIEYEQSGDFGQWRQQINFVAGVGGFGPLIDPLLEMATRRFLTEGIPATFRTTMTYGSWRSPFCPDPRRFREVALDRLNEGCLFWVYLGHGQRRFLDYVQIPGAHFPILGYDDVQQLQAPTPPIAIFLACHTGAFDHEEPSLAEEMLRAGGGPVAVLAGSRVTMPYAMSVLGVTMMDEHFRNQRPTLGEVVMQAKRRMAQPAPLSNGAPAGESEADPSLANHDTTTNLEGIDAHRQLLDALAAAVSPRPDLLQAEREEHVLLFNLLGDPLLQLRHPQTITVEAETGAEAGQTLAVTVSTPLAGRCTVELVNRRDRSKTTLSSRRNFVNGSSWLADFDQAYAQANDRRWFRAEVDAPAGEWSIRVPIPREARGPSHVRLFIQGPDDYATGVHDVYIRRPR